MAQNTTFRKVSNDTAFGLSVFTAAAVANTRLGYKLTATTGRNLTADVCGDNEILAGFPFQKCAVGEAVLLQRGGHFEAIASGTCHINEPFTMAAAGKVRKAVFGTDFVQGFFETEALDGEVVQVRPA